MAGTNQRGVLRAIPPMTIIEGQFLGKYDQPCLTPTITNTPTQTYTPTPDWQFQSNSSANFHFHQYVDADRQLQTFTSTFTPTPTLTPSLTPVPPNGNPDFRCHRRILLFHQTRPTATLTRTPAPATPPPAECQEANCSNLCTFTNPLS